MMTITDTHNFALLLHWPWRIAFRYYSLMLLLLALIYALYLQMTLIPNVLDFSQNALNDLITHYPQSFTLTVSNGNLQSVPETMPIMIPLSKSLHPFERLLVIDPSVEAEKIKDYKSLVLLNQKNLSYTLDPQYSQIFIVPWSDLAPQFSLTSQDILTETSNLLHLLESIKPYAFFLVFIFLFVGHLIFRSLYLVIHGFILHFVLQILRRPLSYSAVIRLSLYTAILTETLWTLMQILYPNLSGSFYSVVFYPITLIALFNARRPITILVTPKTPTTPS